MAMIMTKSKDVSVPPSWAVQPESADALPVAAFLFPVDELNRAWEQFYSSRPGSTEYDEFLATEVVVKPGREWLFSSNVLGAPQLEFKHVAYGEPPAGSHLIVRKRVLREQVMLMELPNAGWSLVLRRLSTQYGVAGELTLKMELNTSHARYKAGEGRKVRLHWSKPPVFTWDGEPTGLIKFRQYYLERGYIDLLSLKAPIGALMRDLGIYWGAGANKVMLGDTVPLDMDDGGANPRDPSAIFLTPGFPEILLGLPPVDRNWIIGTFAPPGSYTFESAELYPGNLGMAAFYERKSTLGVDAPRPASAELQVSPVAEFFEVGLTSERQLLTSSSTGQVGWAFEGENHGALEEERGQFFYRPPTLASSNWVKNPSSKTLVDAVLKSSASAPLVADCVVASVGGQVAKCQFANLNFEPTHFIRVNKRLNKLAFELRFIHEDGSEKAVPAANVRWHVMFGNGQIDSSGLFTPDTRSPLPVSIIWAEDFDENDWYWAMLIVPLPMMSVDDVVQLFAARNS